MEDTGTYRVWTKLMKDLYQIRQNIIPLECGKQTLTVMNMSHKINSEPNAWDEMLVSVG